MAQTRTEIVRMLLAISVGFVVVGASAIRSARDEGIPMAPVARLIESDATKSRRPLLTARPATLSQQGEVGAMFLHGEEDDQPAGACWLASADGALGPCLCSAGSVEDILTPDFMRVLLTSWRDAGRLTNGEWRDRLQEVDAACRPWRAAP